MAVSALILGLLGVFLSVSTPAGTARIERSVASVVVAEVVHCPGETNAPLVAVLHACRQTRKSPNLAALLSPLDWDKGALSAAPARTPVAATVFYVDSYDYMESVWLEARGAAKVVLRSIVDARHSPARLQELDPLVGGLDLLKRGRHG